MGYHRPVASFNIGKQGEHNERRFFAEQADLRNGGGAGREQRSGAAVRRACASAASRR